MRVEWAKSKARADRWQEEITLLTEEMRRVLRYFEWKASWWRTQQDRRSQASVDVRDGVAAYAQKQTTVVNKLARSFASKWYPTLIANGLPTDWPIDVMPNSSGQPATAL
jgi:hypothetical protein